jgi:hypothetical protein
MDNLIEKWRNHGIQVNIWYNRLIENPCLLDDIKIQEWFSNYTPIEGIELYHYNHDMGKPYCVEYDSDGKAHYPNHSEVSYKMYLEKYEWSEFAEMIRFDMGFHTYRGEELCELCKMNIAPHLYATAWAELYANAEIFGGFDSDSFKIKRKRLLKSLKYI